MEMPCVLAWQLCGHDKSMMALDHNKLIKDSYMVLGFCLERFLSCLGGLMEMPGDLACQICRHDKSRTRMALQICRHECKSFFSFLESLMEMHCDLSCQICRHDKSMMFLIYVVV